MTFIPRQQVFNLQTCNKMSVSVHTYGQASQHKIEIINTLRPRQDGRHFPDDNFKYIFLNENV